MSTQTQIQILLNVLDEVTEKYDEIFELKESLLEEANYKSTHDLLTHIYNRAYFEKSVQNLISQNIPFALAFIDLDNFKYVNDTFGHNMGDEILINTANILRKNLKGKDIIGRFGGDEFVAVIEKCNKKCAKTILAKIQKDINNFFKQYNVTCSIGVSFYPEIKDYEILLKTADEKMYEAKNSGKNKITL